MLKHSEVLSSLLPLLQISSFFKVTHIKAYCFDFAELVLGFDSIQKMWSTWKWSSQTTIALPNVIYVCMCIF